MLKYEFDVMDYMVTMETEELEVITDIEERFEEDYNELLNSDFYRLIANNVDADMYGLNIHVYNEKYEEVYNGIAAYYPLDWIDTEVVDYTIYNIINNVNMDIWIK